MTRAEAVALLDRLHAAQNEFYGGGSEVSLRALLAPEIRWAVPGLSPIAGTYRGLDEVLGYFAKRRDLAGGTFTMHRRDVLVGEQSRVAATDGTAVIAGAERRWSTVGLYDLSDRERITSCWLLPLDPTEFDAIWSA